MKLGPAANAIERKEKRTAERDGREYVPRTERGAQVHASRQARAVFDDMRERLTLARETYTQEREQGKDRISAGLEAIRAAASRDRGSEGQGSIADRLSGILERAREGPRERDPEGRSIEERLKTITGRDRDRTPEPPARDRDAKTIAGYAAGIRQGRERMEQDKPDRTDDGPLSEEGLMDRLNEGIERVEQERENALQAEQERRAELQRIYEARGPGSSEAFREMIAIDAAQISRAQAEKDRARGIDRGMDLDFD